MSRCYRLYQVDAFTKHRFAGNPAGVVPDADGLEEHEMLNIAREMNNSETAFIFTADGPDHDVRVRFFTPTTEVPICGHATIAAHYIRAREGAPAGVTRQKTGAGILPVEIEPSEDRDFRIWMTQRPAEFGDVLDDAERVQLLAALGLDVSDLNSRLPIRIVSTGHSKVMIPINNRERLDAIKPALSELAELSSRIACNGYYVFTLSNPDPGFLSHGRMFAPAIGIAEDPVTGNANGPLGAYLLHHGIVLTGPDHRFSFRARQGDAMGRPGQVHVEATRISNQSAIGVRIAGEATIVFKTELRF